jgi:protein-disulfide isomerase
MKGVTILSIAVGMTVAACRAAPPDESASDTDALTRSLLSTATAEAEAAGSATKLRAPAAPVERQEVDLDTLGFDRGQEGALVRVIEMSDYGCGYCRRFHQDTWPVLFRDFIESGKVEWKFIAFVTGMFANSPDATAAAECALEQGPQQFEAMNTRLWNEQPAWKGSGDAATLLRVWADEQRLDMKRFDSCISEGRRAGRIAAANALSQQVGVRGTPTFFVVGYPPLQGALPTETFTQLLTLVHEDAQRRANGGS